MRQKRNLLIIILYFIQKLSSSITSTFVLTYQKIPNYFVLSIFELSNIPYSLKFIFAPIIERFSSLTYGRRKSWIVTSCLLIAALLALFSFITNQEYVLVVAWLSIILIAFSAVQDVALDALALKQIEEPEQISLFQFLGTKLGSLFGSYIFLRLISDKFAISVGFEHKIMSVSTFVLISALITLAITVYTHYTYKQKTLPQQIALVEEGRSFLQIFKVYKTFISPNRKQFRIAVYFLLVNQGLFFFSKSYGYQILRAGFSKEDFNAIDTYCIIPAVIISYLLGKINTNNTWTYLKLIAFLKFSVNLLAFIFQPKSYWEVFLYLFLENILNSMNLFFDGVVVNGLQLNEYSAMTIAMGNSIRNLGINGVYQMWVVGKIGFSRASMIGFVVQSIFLVVLSPMVQWIKGGQQNPKEEEEDPMEPQH